MNAHLSKKVEELKQFSGGPYHPPMWEALAKHVLCCEIRGRIEELMPYSHQKVGTTYYKNQIDFRIEELTKQLKEIEEI